VKFDTTVSRAMIRLRGVCFVESVRYHSLVETR